MMLQVLKFKDGVKIQSSVTKKKKHHKNPHKVFIVFESRVRKQKLRGRWKLGRRRDELESSV